MASALAFVRRGRPFQSKVVAALEACLIHHGAVQIQRKPSRQTATELSVKRARTTSKLADGFRSPRHPDGGFSFGSTLCRPPARKWAFSCSRDGFSVEIDPRSIARSSAWIERAEGALERPRSSLQYPIAQSQPSRAA